MKPYFDQETERKLLQLGRKKYVKTLTLTILWCVLVLGAWIAYIVYSGRSWNSPSVFAYPLLCLLPFFPFRVQKILFSKTFMARWNPHGWFLLTKPFPVPSHTARQRNWKS